MAGNNSQSSSADSSVRKRKLEEAQGAGSPNKRPRQEAAQERRSSARIAAKHANQNGSSSHEQFENPKVKVVVDAIAEVKNLLANSKNFPGFDRNRTAEVIQQIGRQINSLPSVTDRNVDVIHGQLKILLDMNAVIKADYGMFSSNNAFADELQKLCNSFDLKWQFAAEQYEKQPKASSHTNKADLELEKLKEKGVEFEKQIEALKEKHAEELRKKDEELRKKDEEHKDVIAQLEQRHTTALARVETSFEEKLTQSIAVTFQRAESVFNQRLAEIEKNFERKLDDVRLNQHHVQGHAPTGVREVASSSSRDTRKIVKYVPDEKLKVLDAFAALDYRNSNFYTTNQDGINALLTGLLQDIFEPKPSVLSKRLQHGNAAVKDFVFAVSKLQKNLALNESLTKQEKTFITTLMNFAQSTEEDNSQTIILERIDSCKLKEKSCQTERVKMNVLSSILTLAKEGNEIQLPDQVVKSLNDYKENIKITVKNAEKGQSATCS